jgi:hypothetical protein
MRRRLNQLVGVAMILSMIALFGCKKDKKESAPVLPPMSAFSIDLAAFTSDVPVKNTDSMSTYHAVVNAVGYWNVVLSLSLAIPVAAYAEALKQEAVRVDNDTWKWSYAVNDIYSAQLVADVVSDSVYFSMYVTKAEEFDSLLWFTGKCDILMTGGEWNLFDIPANPSVSWLKIKWNGNYETETFDIRYTNVYPGNEYENSYIEYGKTTDPDYDVYYDLYNSLSDLTYSVNYNTETEAGYLAFNGNQYCWNKNHANCVCPGTIGK